MANAEMNNFWLWGTWGKRVIKSPFLTQKVPGRIRDVIIGHTFIIALREDGHLISWGEDKVGCLGLGPDHTNCQEPRKVPFPAEFKGKVIDIQFGKHHILALTSQGKVYAWGDNAAGQLGLGDTQMRFEPFLVEELQKYTVIQILAVDGMSYALTSHGVVYAWGDNKDGALALEHDNPRVIKPEPMFRMKEAGTTVKKLAIKDCGGTSKGRTIIAFVEMAEPLSDKDKIGGFEKPLGEFEPANKEQVINEGMEKDIFEGVDLMRRVMDNTQDWWSHMLEVRHGSPYDENPLQSDAENDKEGDDNCTVMQLDTFVGLDILERACYELDMLMQSAKEQLLEIRSKKGTKNVKFMLSLFMDDCKLRREKIRRTVAARQLMDYKRGVAQAEDGDILGKEGHPEDLIRDASEQVTRTLKRVRDLKTYDLFTLVLRDSLGEVLESKLQVLATQGEVIKARSGHPANPSIAALRIIKERWTELKRFSIYNLYQECNLRGQGLSYSSDDEMLAFLVQSSDSKIDQIIQVDRDKLVSRDPLLPGICYDLLVENAELRKMCNTYQLKVLLMKGGKVNKKKDENQLALGMGA